MGPTGKVSFKDMPVDDFAEASNTTLSFVIVIEYFITECIGILKTDEGAFDIS